MEEKEVGATLGIAKELLLRSACMSKSEWGEENGDVNADRQPRQDPRDKCGHLHPLPPSHGSCDVGQSSYKIGAMCRDMGTDPTYMSRWHNKSLPIQRLSLAPHMKPWQVTLEW